MNICDFGKHKGERYTRIPVGYLLWMVNNDHTRKALAQAELDRRGTVFPTLELSGHAIDRASLRLLKIWGTTRQTDEGIHAWLLRMCSLALEAVPEHVLSAVDPQSPDPTLVTYYRGLKFVFQMGSHWPTLKTIMKGSRT